MDLAASNWLWRDKCAWSVQARKCSAERILRGEILQRLGPKDSFLNQLNALNFNLLALIKDD
jgi:hypothetical protein